MTSLAPTPPRRTGYRTYARPTRQKIADLLDFRHGRTAAEIAEAIPGITLSGVYQALAMMEAEGLVIKERRGSNIMAHWRLSRDWE